MKKQNVNETANIVICNVNYDSMQSVRADTKKMVAEIGHTMHDTASDLQVCYIAELCLKYSEKVESLKDACALYNEIHGRTVNKDDQNAADKKLADLVRTSQEINAHKEACKNIAYEIARYVVVCRERGSALLYMCANTQYTYWTAKEDRKTGKISAATATARIKCSDFASGNLSAMGYDPAWYTLLEALSALMIDKIASPDISKKVKKFAEKVHISVDGVKNKATVKELSGKSRKALVNAMIMAMIGPGYAISTAYANALAYAGVDTKKDGSGEKIWNEVDFSNFFAGICADAVRIKNGEEPKFNITYSTAKFGKETATIPATETTTTTAGNTAA